MKVRRRLARLGAVALKGSVYVLPASDESSEDFHWVRKEILDGGGEATLAESELVGGLSDDELEAKFRAERDSEYGEVVAQARALAGTRGAGGSEHDHAARLSAVTRLERRTEEIAAIDYFGGTLRQTAEALLAELRRLVEKLPVGTEPPHDAPVRARTWVTRSGIRVDRIASAWLIRRSIDPEAVFKFVSAKGYEPAPGELRFDMFEAEYAHEAECCTFETLVARFRLDEPGLSAVAEVVHDIDLKEAKFGREEAAGVAASIAGLCREHRDDSERLRRGSVIFDALLAYYALKQPQR